MESKPMESKPCRVCGLHEENLMELTQGPAPCIEALAATVRSLREEVAELKLKKAAPAEH